MRRRPSRRSMRRSLAGNISGVKRDSADESNGEQIYDTSEGPVLVALNGNQVFTSESFNLTLARKLGVADAGCASDRKSADRGQSRTGARVERRGL